MKPIQIKRLRKALGLRIIDFAEQLGVSTATVVNWEQGHSQPSFTNIRLLEKLSKDFPELESIIEIVVTVGAREVGQYSPIITSLVLDGDRYSIGPVEIRSDLVFSTVEQAVQLGQELAVHYAHRHYPNSKDYYVTVQDGPVKLTEGSSS